MKKSLKSAKKVRGFVKEVDCDKFWADVYDETGDVLIEHDICFCISICDNKEKLKAGALFSLTENEKMIFDPPRFYTAKEIEEAKNRGRALFDLLNSPERCNK